MIPQKTMHNTYTWRETFEGQEHHEQDKNSTQPQPPSCTLLAPLKTPCRPLSPYPPATQTLLA